MNSLNLTNVVLASMYLQQGDVDARPRCKFGKSSEIGYDSVRNKLLASLVADGLLGSVSLPLLRTEGDCTIREGWGLREMKVEKSIEKRIRVNGRNIPVVLLRKKLCIRTATTD